MGWSGLDDEDAELSACYVETVVADWNGMRVPYSRAGGVWDPEFEL